jgi:hypothetical protein
MCESLLTTVNSEVMNDAKRTNTFRDNLNENCIPLYGKSIYKGFADRLPLEGYERVLDFVMWYGHSCILYS